MTRHTTLAQAILTALALVSVSGAFEVYTVWPFDSAEARRRQQEAAASLQLPVEFSVDLGVGVPLVFELIPAGRSRLGSPPTEPGYEGDEALRFDTITAPFYMCKYQLTRAQYKAVTGGYPNDPLYTQGLLRKTFASEVYRKLYPAAELDFEKYKERNHCPKLIQTFNTSVWLGSTKMFLGSRQDMADIADAVWKIYHHAEKIKKA